MHRTKESSQNTPLIVVNSGISNLWISVRLLWCMIKGVFFTVYENASNFPEKFILAIWRSYACLGDWRVLTVFIRLIANWIMPFCWHFNEFLCILWCCKHILMMFTISLSYSANQSCTSCRRNILIRECLLLYLEECVGLLSVQLQRQVK